jgi:hypothetical protein
MILVALFLAVVISVPVCSGRLSRLVELPLRSTWLVMSALVIQTVIISFVPTIGSGAGNIVHLGTYAMAAGFLLLNHRLPGIRLLVVGCASNLVAIMANGGVMPSSEWATRTAGLTVDPTEFANSRTLDHPRLLMFGDIFAIPKTWPLANVFSVGDLLLVIGAAVLLHVGSGSRLARSRSAPRVPPVICHP